METFPNSALAFVEQIILLFFTLMLFVGIAGGRADSVLKPLLDIIGQLFGALLSVLSMLLVMLIKLFSTLIVAGIQQAGAAPSGALRRQSRRDQEFFQYSISIQVNHMTNTNPVIAGTLLMLKVDRHFKVAFLADRYELRAMARDFFPCAYERTTAKLLYAHGLIDQPQLFELVKEGRQEIMQGVFSATLICAIVLGLSQEPDSIEDVENNFLVDTAAKQKFRQLSAHFRLIMIAFERYLHVRVSGQYVRYRSDSDRNFGR